MKCPLHSQKMIKSKWLPDLGLDEKMTRWVCIDCCNYWYYTPKWKELRREKC